MFSIGGNTRVPTKTSGEAVPQAPANHSIIEERDQHFLCTQVTTNYDKRRVPCRKINCEDKSVCYHMDHRACSGSSKLFHSNCIVCYVTLVLYNYTERLS